MKTRSMQKENTEDVTVRQIELRCDEKKGEHHGGYINISPEWNRHFNAWNPAMKTRLVETVMLGRRMNPLWFIYSENGETSSVLDGQHRLKTILSFYDNKFKLVGKHLLELDPVEYDKKSFEDLNSDDKLLIKNYKFSVNTLPSNYESDKNKLKQMNFILNNSSQKHTQYELWKTLFMPINRIFKGYETQYSNLFSRTNYYSNRTNKREALTQEINKLLVFAELKVDPWPKCCTSTETLVQFWRDNIGSQEKDIIEYAKVNENNIKKKLNFMLYVLDDFMDNKIFSKKGWKIENFITVSRIGNKTNFSTNRYNRHRKNLLKILKSEIFMEDPVELQNKLGCSSRNSKFQKKLIIHVDTLLDKELDMNNPENNRFFSQNQRKQKLEMQNGICTLCGNEIEPHQLAHADHIIEWVKGGKTILSNCDILHKRCHEMK